MGCGVQVEGCQTMLPLMARWEVAPDPRVADWCTEDVRAALDHYPHDQVVWTPYVGEIDASHPAVAAGHPLFDRHLLLLCLGTCEVLYLELVVRTLGWHQSAIEVPSLGREGHSRRRFFAEDWDWSEEHGTTIAYWREGGEQVLRQTDLEDSAAYLEGYRARYVGRLRLDRRVLSESQAVRLLEGRLVEQEVTLERLRAEVRALPARGDLAVHLQKVLDQAQERIQELEAEVHTFFVLVVSTLDQSRSTLVPDSRRPSCQTGTSGQVDTRPNFQQTSLPNWESRAGRHTPAETEKREFLCTHGCLGFRGFDLGFRAHAPQSTLWTYGAINTHVPCTPKAREPIHFQKKPFGGQRGFSRSVTISRSCKSSFQEEGQGNQGESLERRLLCKAREQIQLKRLRRRRISGISDAIKAEHHQLRRISIDFHQASSIEVSARPLHRRTLFLNLFPSSQSFFCTLSRRALVCESSHSLCGLSRRAQFGVVVLRLLFEPSCSVWSRRAPGVFESSCSRVFGVVVLLCELYSGVDTRSKQVDTSPRFQKTQLPDWDIRSTLDQVDTRSGQVDTLRLKLKNVNFFVHVAAWDLGDLT
ncbi:hypothetical protein Taro_009160 [Colocasia esculenta]|uniref:Aminotransferase-like plant mobile domain-containing protein n=1 Tax=Colocasia esculenta TaxID=4460 RepID=A0A843U468_COLES|nr:hypothetical protein [Colocasia esculenta]